MTTDTKAADRAQQAASTAAEESKHVADVAAAEARSLAAEATHQVRDLAGNTMSEVQGQVEDQTRQQKDRLAGSLATLGGDLGSMAESGSGLAADLAHEVADRAQTLSQHLEGREPRELLDDVRRFARERPGTFLLGALAAGVVVGRLARSTKDAAAAADAGLGDGPATDSTASSRTGEPGVTPSGAPDTAPVAAGHVQPNQSLDQSTMPATVPSTRVNTSDPWGGPAR